MPDQTRNINLLRTLVDAMSPAPYAVHPITQLAGVDEDSGRSGVWIDGPNWVEADEALWFDPADAAGLIALRNAASALVDLAEAAEFVRHESSCPQVAWSHLVLEGHRHDEMPVCSCWRHPIAEALDRLRTSLKLEES